MTFTGSVSAGKAIHAACSETMKRSTLELGGNDVSCCRSSPSAAPAGDVVVVNGGGNSVMWCWLMMYINTIKIIIHSMVIMWMP